MKKKHSQINWWYKIIVLSILKNHKAEEERSNIWLFLFKKIKCNNENNNLMK